jgi:TRAP-type C4-dicarboxylate transport system permease small subunit
LLRFYNLTVKVVASVLMSAIVVIMALQIFHRYVLNDSLIWAEEICRYLLVLISFLFIGAAFQRGDLVSIGFVAAALPARARAALQAALFVIYILFLLVLSYYCWRFAVISSRFAIPSVDFILSAMTGREVSRAVSMYWLYMVMPLGFIVLALHMVVALVPMLRIIAGRVEPGAGPTP